MTLERGAGRSILSVALSLAILQTGCVTTPERGGGGADGTGAFSPAEQRLRDESASFDGKSSMQGCLAGAVLGAALGMLSGGNRGNNMAIGAAAGCAAGFAANAYVQNRRQQYQDNEQRILAMTADVQAENQRIASLIATSEEVLAADRRRLAHLDALYKKRAISADQARRELARVQANRGQLQSTVDSLKKRHNEWVDIANEERRVGADTAPLDREIGTLKDRVSGLQQEVSLLDKQINASPAAG